MTRLSGAPAAAGEDFPLATVVVLCRNERVHIDNCLDSLLRNTYPQERLEILVVDGMSEDGTREVVADYAARFPCIRLIDNPRRITPSAMNIGIRAARGEAIAIIGSHTTYDPDYLAECVRHLREYDADVVGAVAQYVPRNSSLIGRAIASVLSHPFGAGANVAYKIGAPKPTWVDTVSSAVYRSAVFERVGYFNEQLRFSQDYEFSVRLRKAGGRILLVPSAVIRYFARSDLKSFTKHNYRNGLWIILPALYTDVLPVAWRHLVPLAFVVTVAGAIVFAVAGFSSGVWVLGGVLGAYSALAFVSAVQIARRERDLRFVPLMLFVFLSLHVAYGIGSVVGVLRAAGVLLQRALRRRS